MPRARRPTPAQRRVSRQLRASLARTRGAEKILRSPLRSLARHCGEMVRHTYDPRDPQGSALRAQRMLERYAQVIGPWAEDLSERMMEDVERRELTVWRTLGREMERPLAQEIAGARTDAMRRRAVEETRNYINDIPIRAAERIGSLIVQVRVGRRTAEEAGAMIRRTGHVARAHADTIVRSQVGSTGTSLMRSHAQHLGSEGYVWRDMRDNKVRPEHRRLHGTFQRWSDPPVAGPNGERYHAGEGINCRCLAIPQIPDVVPDRRMRI